MKISVAQFLIILALIPIGNTSFADPSEICQVAITNAERAKETFLATNPDLESIGETPAIIL